MRSSEAPFDGRLTAEQAFAAYERVRRRLPSAAFPTAPRRAATLEAVAADYDVFLLDAFGVLNVGDSPIPGAPERVAMLQRAGKRVMVLTNSASHPAEVVLAKYCGLGFDFAAEDVVSSRDALHAGLSARSDATWGVMAPDGARIEELGPRAMPLGDAPAPYETASGFILLGSAGWTEARQVRLAAALRARPRPVLVGNPDIVAPRESGLTLEPGHYAHRLADETGIAPEFYGKPFANIFDLALGRLGSAVPRERILMVGDTLHTDVLGGAAKGMHTALVTGFGLFRGGDAEGAMARSGIVPHHVIERI